MMKRHGCLETGSDAPYLPARRREPRGSVECLSGFPLAERGRPGRSQSEGGIEIETHSGRAALLESTKQLFVCHGLWRHTTHSLARRGQGQGKSHEEAVRGRNGGQLHWGWECRSTGRRLYPKSRIGWRRRQQRGSTCTGRPERTWKSRRLLEARICRRMTLETESVERSRYERYVRKDQRAL